MDEIEEIESAEFALTCRTPECENDSIEIIAPAPVDPALRHVVCGPCGVEISDVHPVNG